MALGREDLMVLIGGNNAALDRAMKDSTRGVRSARVSMSRDLRQIDRAVGAAMGRATRAVFNMRNAVIALGAAIGATKLAATFDREMSRIVGLTGTAREEVDGMRTDLLALATALGKSPQELAEALFFISSSGLQGAAAMEALEASAKASAAGLGETKIIADAVTSAINSYGAEALDAGKATGILVAAVREGKAEAEDIAGAMGRVLPIAAELGVSFDQVAATVAALTRGGLSADEVVTSLRATLTALLKPTAQSADALAAVGLSAADLRRQIREEGLLATLTSLRKAFGDNDEALAAAFGNVRALIGIMGLTGESAAEVERIFASLANTTEQDLNEAFEVAAETAEFQLDRAMAGVNASMIAFGTALTEKPRPPRLVRRPDGTAAGDHRADGLPTRSHLRDAPGVAG